MTVYIVDLEKLETRYTKEWSSHVPELIGTLGKEVVVISGPDDIPSVPTPGMFLNFSATNVYKAVQLEKISRLFCEGRIKDGDYFLFTDAWHPGVINLKYMIDLLGIKAKIGGMWHAGSYDKWDGLGQLVGAAPWIRHAEQSFYHAFDHNYFATEFHIKLFVETLFGETPDWEQRQREKTKIIRTGWPMEYMNSTLAEYKHMPKRDLIVFPHRIAPEKQVAIFRDLARSIPQYHFMVCQDSQLSKHEYHRLLGKAKMVFSCSKQETLGISPFEGAVLDAIPMVPDSLSYTEMYDPTFKYPAYWVEDFDSYVKYKPLLIDEIVYRMNQFNTAQASVKSCADRLSADFFSAGSMLSTIQSAH